jgi:hypothetical protein
LDLLRHNGRFFLLLEMTGVSEVDGACTASTSFNIAADLSEDIAAALIRTVLDVEAVVVPFVAFAAIPDPG